MTWHLSARWIWKQCVRRHQLVIASFVFISVCAFAAHFIAFILCLMPLFLLNARLLPSIVRAHNAAPIESQYQFQYIVYPFRQQFPQPFNTRPYIFKRRKSAAHRLSQDILIVI